jgi:hypothetical protein
MPIIKDLTKIIDFKSPVKKWSSLSTTNINSPNI